MIKSVRVSHGITLQYLERGTASGVPLVFLHGVTDSCRSFEPLLDRLPDTLHAFAISQRGHGGSTKPVSGYFYADMAEDLRGFLDALQLPAAVIAGHSMGSVVAQRFAASYPDRVAGLVLMGAFRTMHNDPGLGAYWTSTLAALADPIDPAIARDFQLSTLARPVPPEFLETVISESLRVPARVWRAAFRGFLDTPDFTKELAALGAPTLIAWGDRDTFTSLADQEWLQQVIPHSRRLVYAGAGHAFHWEDPDRFAADLVEFVYERRVAANALSA